MNCTWRGCSGEGTEPQVGRDGAEWARLCSKHAKALDEALASADPKKLLGAWACAQSQEAREATLRGMQLGAAAIVGAYKKAKGIE